MRERNSEVVMVDSMTRLHRVHTFFECHNALPTYFFCNKTKPLNRTVDGSLHDNGLGGDVEIGMELGTRQQQPRVVLLGLVEATIRGNTICPFI